MKGRKAGKIKDFRKIPLAFFLWAWYNQ